MSQRRRPRWSARTTAKVLLVAPALGLLTVFYLGPAIASAALSVHRWSGLSEVTFVGLENFRELFFEDPAFWGNVRVTLIVVALALVMTLPLALWLAWCLSTSSSKLTPVFRWALFIPVVLPLASTALLWREFFSPLPTGTANQVIGFFGLDPVTWLGDPSTALWALMIALVWGGVGLFIVILVSSLSAIPPGLNEAARLETQSAWKVFRYVTLPLLRDGLSASALIIVAGAFSGFTALAVIMTAGGPNRSTEVLGIRAYFEAFQAHDYGGANAVTFVTTVLASIVIAAIMWYSGRRRIEY